ncbi:ATP-binding cassette domain-containing protein [Streptomyces sp. NPDC059349]|uniref:ATP-binding cassette domain-containing protein n=1 Tax=Streptomyces sp. NPDC059349 TaxID=3346808 RepID=UPI0036823992
MLGYILAGLVLGGIYAISAASIVVTYVSAGVLNFSFGAIAFFIARLYYYLHVQLGWPVATAALVAVAVAGPALGAALHYLLFRFLSQAGPLTKVVSTIGVSVAIPAASELIFGDKAILTSPGLAPQPVPVYHLAGVAITLDQIIAYACVVVVLAAGTYILRRTSTGLMVRSTVDSEALTSLSGVSTSRVAVGVWSAGTFLAGLAGVLAAPILNVNSVDNYTLLTASAFAAVVAARLRSLPIAVGVGLLMGVVGSLLQWLLPVSGKWTADIISSVPFAMVFVFLLIYSWRGAVGGERAGSTLDRAIHVEPKAAVGLQHTGRHRAGRPVGVRVATGLAGLVPRNLFLVVAALLPLLLTGYRAGLVAEALAMGIVFLSYTLLTGEAGLISLCQISFAGIGALATGQVATVLHLPVLLGVLAGGVLAGVAGVVVGALTVRMGNLYVALVTLTLGLLLSSVVFDAERFAQSGIGVTVDRPGFVADDRAFSYFMLAVFVVAALVVTAIRRSTTGLALGALRSSETGARATGVSVLRMKISIFTLSAMLAGFGGGFLAIYNGAALPSSYDTIIGLVWFAVLVTNGTRSNNAALASGLFFVFLPDIFSSYVPDRWGPVPNLLFGLGAVLLARNPEGVITLNGRQLQAAGRALLRRLRPAKTAADAQVVANLPDRPGERAPLRERPLTTAPADLRDQPGSVLAARGVSVRFGGLKALQDAEIDVPAGTIVGLLGPNGAGKSTLLGVLSGNVHAQEGTVLLGGEPVSGMTPQGRVRRGLGRTFQHPELFGDLTVRDHLLLAHRLDERPSRSWSDPFTGRCLRDDPDERAAVDEVLELLGLHDVADLPAAGLPLGMCRLVEIGRAIATGPRIVLLDEPFSGLNAGESETLADALTRIVAARGISMLLVEHDVELVFGLCSRVYVLDFGKLIAQGTPAEIRANDTVRSAYLGEVEADPVPGPRAATRVAASASVPTGEGPAAGREITLSVEDLTVDYGNATAIRDVSLSVPKGSVTALLGANGAGKSTIARALSGLVPVRSGRVLFEGVDITRMPAHHIRRLGLAHLPEGRGVFPALTVAENLRIAVQTAPKPQRAEAIDRAMEMFPVLADRRTQLAGTLSGGQQQMLSLARILADLPRLVVADEISLGLAPLVVDEVFEGLRRAIDMDVSIIVIEQFVHRALQLADDCHIMRRGRLVWSGAATDARGDIFEHYLGGSAEDVAAADREAEGIEPVGERA